MRRVLATVGLATLVATTASACSLGHKQAMADQVIGSLHRVEAAGTATGTITIAAIVIHSKLPVTPGPPRIVNGLAPDLKTVIDFKEDRAAVGLAAGDDPASAAILFDGTRVL